MDGYQQFEHIKIQFMAQLASLSHQLQQASQIADQYHNIVQQMPYTGNGVAVTLPKALAGAPAAAAPSGPGRKRKATADANGDGETDGRRRRKREPKDPNRPKRPPSAYLFYQNEVRQDLKTTHPFTPHHELLGMIAKQWSMMSDVEKKPYEDKNRASKAEYDNLIGVYNLQNGILPKGAKKVPSQSPVIPVAAPPVVETATPSPAEESSVEASEVEESEEADESSEEEAAASPPAPTKKPRSTTSVPPAPTKGRKEKKAKA